MVGASEIARQYDHPRQHARRLHQREAGVSAEGVLARELDREVQTLVEDARKWMRRVETDRRHHRHDLLQEKRLDPGFLRVAPVVAPQEPNALALELGQQFLIP